MPVSTHPLKIKTACLLLLTVGRGLLLIQEHRLELTLAACLLLLPSQDLLHQWHLFLIVLDEVPDSALQLAFGHLDVLDRGIAPRPMLVAQVLALGSAPC